jgi:hypothetical protein
MIEVRYTHKLYTIFISGMLETLGLNDKQRDFVFMLVEVGVALSADNIPSESKQNKKSVFDKVYFFSYIWSIGAPCAR